jgi:hypothetical protein
MEAASEDTTSKSRSSVIEILTLKTAAKNDSPLSMVNDYSYWSISHGRSAAEISQRKRPHPERPQVSVFSLLSMAAEPLRRETTATQRLAESAITCSAVLRLAGVSQVLMWCKRKRPLRTAAVRWDQGPSRGNDTIGRNNRVLLEMGSRLGTRHPSLGPAGMHELHPSCLQTATLVLVQERGCSSTSHKPCNPLNLKR